MPLVAILDARKSRSIAFIAISDKEATFKLKFVNKMATGSHLNAKKSHFSPFQINTQL